MKYTEFQRKCKYRKWTSFGHYTCELTGSGCPLKKSENCPMFNKMLKSSNSKKLRTG